MLNVNMTNVVKLCSYAELQAFHCMLVVVLANAILTNVIRLSGMAPAWDLCFQDFGSCKY